MAHTPGNGFGNRIPGVFKYSLQHFLADIIFFCPIGNFLALIKINLHIGV